MTLLKSLLINTVSNGHRELTLQLVNFYIISVFNIP